MTDPVLTPLLLTIKVASTATVAVVAVGTFVGYALARARFWGKELVDALLTLPLVLPPTVLGYYLLVVVGRQGPLGGFLERTFGITLVFTWQGAAIAAALVSLPLLVKSARAAFEGVDPELEQAARVLGVGEVAAFFRVSLPLAWRGVLAGAMLAFARAMGEFGATLMVAGSLPGRTQTLSLAIYEAVQSGEDRLANTLVLVASATCVLFLVLSAQLLRRRAPVSQ